jgi:hypothetical protein
MNADLHKKRISLLLILLLVIQSLLIGFRVVRTNSSLEPNRELDPSIELSRADRNARSNNRAGESLREATAISARGLRRETQAERKPLFELVGNDLRVTGEAALALGLDSEQTRQVQMEVDLAFRKFAEIARAKHTVSDAPGGFIRYEIPPIPEGSAILESLKTRLQQQLGEEIGRRLYEGFGTNKFFGDFGKNKVYYDVKAVIPVAINQLEIGMAKVTAFEPQTGNVIFRSSQVVYDWEKVRSYPYFIQNANESK